MKGKIGMSGKIVVIVTAAASCLAGGSAEKSPQKDDFVFSENVPGNNIIPFELDVKSDAGTQARRRTPMKKGVPIAVIAAAMLMLAGFAYAIMKMQELSIGEYTYTEPNPLNSTEKVIVTNEFISLQGLQDSPEYQATKEWQDFLRSYDTDGAILDKIDNEPTGLEDLALFYQVYTQEMYDKLCEIAEKYHLKLHSQMDLVDQEELDYRVGGAFMGEGLSGGWAYIYENGTFQFDGEAMIDEKVVHMQFRRSVKGTLEEPVLNIGNVEKYQEVQYETLCGETVLLELSTDHSLIYADFEECLLLVNVLAGTGEGFLDDTEGAITMEDLKRIADGIDFTVLKNVITPEMRGDSVVTPEQDSTPEDSAMDMGAEIIGTGIETYLSNLEPDRIQAYQAVLKDIYHNQTFPGGRELGYDGFPMSDNKFAVGDIDGDGSAELILLYITTYVGGHSQIIYDYDSSTGSVREQFIEYPAVVYFDNGILKADWSHNHSLSEKIWPYTLYRYDEEKDSYEAIAMVEAWDKSFADKDSEGNTFPDDVDKDGDLLVYYVMDPGKYELKEPVDYEEYERWYDSYTRDAGTITITYMELTEENIESLLPEESGR